MPNLELPHAIRSFVGATNEQSTDAFVASFTHDAHLEDWGRSFDGHDGVARWDRTDNIGVNAHLEPVTIVPGPTPSSFIMTVQVSGEGFNGLGTMTIETRGDLISRLVIS